eukprot:gene12085-16278_t
MHNPSFRPSRAGLALVMALLVSFLLGACSTPSRNLPPAPGTAQVAGATGPRYKIGPLDTLNVVVWRNPELSATVTVRPDGYVSTPLVEDLQDA